MALGYVAVFRACWLSLCLMCQYQALSKDNRKRIDQQLLTLVESGPPECVVRPPRRASRVQPFNPNSGRLGKLPDDPTILGRIATLWEALQACSRDPAKAEPTMYPIMKELLEVRCGSVLWPFA